MGNYNGQKVTVSKATDTNDQVTVTFEDGTTALVALGAVGDLTPEERAALGVIPPPTDPEGPIDA